MEPNTEEDLRRFTSQVELLVHDGEELDWIPRRRNNTNCPSRGNVNQTKHKEPCPEEEIRKISSNIQYFIQGGKGHNWIPRMTKETDWPALKNIIETNTINQTKSDGPRTPRPPSHPANQQSDPQSEYFGLLSREIAFNSPVINCKPPPKPTGIPRETGGRRNHILTGPPYPYMSPLHGEQPPKLSNNQGLPSSLINQSLPSRSNNTTQCLQGTPKITNHNRNVIQAQDINVGQHYVQPHMNFSGFIPPHAPLFMLQQHYLPGYQYINQHQQRQQNHAPPYYSAAAAAAPANMILNSPYGHGHYPNPVQMYYSMPRAPTPTGPGQQLQQGAQAQPLLAPPAQMHQGPLSLVPMPKQTVTPNQQPQAQPQQDKRRSRSDALKIINPETLEEVTVEIDNRNTPSPSRKSSARQTPQPNNTDVAAEFAAKVYKLAAEAKRVTTQTLTATVNSTTTTVAQTITTPICSSSLKLSPRTTTTNTISSVESSFILFENIETTIV